MKARGFLLHGCTSILLDHMPALGLWLDLGCSSEKDGDLRGPWATQLQNRVPKSLRVVWGLRNNGDSYPRHRPCIQQGARTSRGTMDNHQPGLRLCIQQGARTSGAGPWGYTYSDRWAQVLPRDNHRGLNLRAPDAIYHLAFPIRDLEESSDLGEGSSLAHTSSLWPLYQCGVLGEGVSAGLPKRSWDHRVL